MGSLEKGLSWISLFIALAPMLGFMGTVIGMIDAFDSIEAAGDISPSLVAGGIKVALLTTVFGLIVAMILQIFYNYLISKVDSIVNDMEDVIVRNYGTSHRVAVFVYLHCIPNRSVPMRMEFHGMSNNICHLMISTII